jgi:hypothetical protein
VFISRPTALLASDGGDGLQIWRVGANILNKQSRTTDKGQSSSWGVGRGANNSSPWKNKLVTKEHKKPRTWEVDTACLILFGLSPLPCFFLWFFIIYSLFLQWFLSLPSFFVEFSFLLYVFIFSSWELCAYFVSQVNTRKNSKEIDYVNRK